MLRSVELGREAVGTAVTTPASIDSAVALTVPTVATAPGILECTVVLEGAVTARYRVDGTNPTTAAGHLLPAPTATSPVTLLLRGRAMVEGFRIIGTAAGDSITYWFAQVDMM